MPTTNTKRRWGTTMLFFGALWPTTSRNGTLPSIIAVDNRSNCMVNITDHMGIHHHPPTPTHKTTRPYIIPFISIKNHREQFISGEPYCPSNSLYIKTKKGTFCVWCDEIGIMKALEFTPGSMRDDCIPVTLFKPMADSIGSYIKQSMVFILLVSQDGEPYLMKLDHQESIQ